MRYGQRDGHGLYGILEDSGEGLLCHECGKRWRHLGIHVISGHAIIPAIYRERYGLQRRVGLVTAAVRLQMSVGATDLLDSPTGAPFLAARSTAKATQARRAAVPPAIRAASRHAVSLSRRRRPRLAVVIICAQCGAEFCHSSTADNAGSASAPALPATPAQAHSRSSDRHPTAAAKLNRTPIANSWDAASRPASAVVASRARLARWGIPSEAARHSGYAPRHSAEAEPPVQLPLA